MCTRQIAETILPVGISGIVLAAAVAAMMSTASGALIAASTVARTDVVPLLLQYHRPPTGSGSSDNPEHDLHSNRLYVVVLGVVVIVIAALLNDVVGGADGRVRHSGRRPAGRDPRRFRLEARNRCRRPVVDGGGTVVDARHDGRRRRRSRQRADLLRTRRSLVAYVVASLLTPRTPPSVMQRWDARLRGATEPTADAENAEPDVAINSAA